MADLESLSTEDLIALAGSPAASTDLSAFSNDQLMQLAGPPTVGEAFVQGIKDTPSAIVGMPGAIYGMGKDVVQSVASPVQAVNSGQAERALRQVGGFSAGIAGAGSLGGAGAAIGSVLGPIGTAGGALLGGGLGFGAGMLGFNKLLQATGVDPGTSAEKDAAELAYNTGIGIATGGVSKGAGAALKAVGLPTSLRSGATDLEASALNIRPTDVKASRKFETKGSAGEDAPLYRALEGARERGLFKGDKSPEALNAKNQASIEADAGKVNAIIQAVDNAKSDVIAPEFANTKAFIEKAAPGTRATLQGQFERFVQEFSDRWDGSLAYLNDVKRAIARKGYSGLTDSKDLDKAIAADLRVAVEKGVEKYGGADQLKELKRLNAQMGESITLRSVLARGQDIAESQGALSTALRRAGVSPSNIPGMSYIAAVATGNPLLAVPGALVQALNTRTGKFGVGSTLRGSANLIDAIAEFPQNITVPAMAPRAVREQSSLLDALTFPNQILLEGAK